MQCPACQHENKPAARFCEGCGARLARACPSCGEESGPQAHFCPACGATLTEPTTAPRAGRQPAGDDAAAPPGERRQLTVVFCDLVGSTSLSQQLDAEEWRYVVAQYQKAATAAVTRVGGHVAKELGDGLLVYFGWPDAREDDPERAVRAGLDILGAMEPVNARLAAGDGTRLAVRVGMHTGPVVIADGGEVFGETPNIAARVQAAAAPDTVCITAATQRLVAGIFVMEEQAPQTLKGVREPMVLYRVLQPSGVRSRLDVAAGRLTPYIGRDLELGTLVDRWERAAEGDGQNVLIVGEAGVGKSRLVYQLHERLAHVPHTWLECRSTPYTEGTPFYPVIDLVQQGLAFAPENTAVEKLEKLERAVTLARLDLHEAVPLVADFLGLAPPEGYPRLALSPDAQRRKTMELLAAWMLALAEVQPLVTFVEDLHWVDPSSLELLGRLMAQTATARVLLVGTARPDFTPPWPARSNLTMLQLTRLTKRQAREMIGVLGGGTLPAEMIDTLVARADGVPLYVEELTKGVAEPDVARGVDAIPATLADSLMARLDRLSAAKEVAQRAAVLGREFPYALLAGIAEMDEAGLRQGLTRLVEAEILFVRGEPPAAAYTFKHALVQEAAYASLLKRTRQQLHGRVVDVLVADFPERMAAEPEVVARHAEAAGRTDEAIGYHERAGEQAQARSAHPEAIGHLRHAITLLATRPEAKERDAREAMLQLALAGSLRPARGIAHPETGAAYERAQALSEQTGDTRRLGLALGGLASVCSNGGNPERGRALASQVLTLAEQSGDSELALLGNVELAVAETWLGEAPPAFAHFEAGRKLYEATRHHAPGSTTRGDPAVMPVSYLDVGIIALAQGSWTQWFLGWPDRALARARKAVDLAQDLGDPFNLGYALTAECIVHGNRRDVTAQRQRAEEGIALSEANGFPLWLGICRFNHAMARVAAGELGAVADLLPALALCAETGNQAGAPDIFAALAETYMVAGQLVEARGAVETGFAIAVQTGQPGADANLHRLQGEIVLKMADGPERSIEADTTAEECFRRALDVARAQEGKSFELRAAISLARLWRDQGKRTAARDLLGPVYGWFTEGFDTRDLTDAKALLGSGQGISHEGRAK